MKIIFLEKGTLGEGIDYSEFEKLGEVVYYDMTTKEQTPDRVKDADVIVVNKVPMNAETLKGAENLKLICITATGTNIVDFDYTNQQGIAVTNVKGYSTDTVVQHTFALLFYVMEQLAYHDRYVKSGEYMKSNSFTHVERSFHDLKGLTWGIVGLGDIGRGVARIAEAFGCRVVYYSTSGKNNNADYERVDFEQLLAESDIVSIHAPLNDATNHLFDEKAFAKMKKSAILLNLGRGPIVDEQALTDALNNETIFAAGLDVLCVEPMLESNPLRNVKNTDRLIITPHIAWASEEARTRLMVEVAENIKAFIKGEERNVVK